MPHSFVFTTTVRAMTTTRYRMTLAALGLALAAVIAGAVIFAPSGTNPTLPDALESYSPTDGAIVLRQTQVSIDLRPGFVISLTVDGVPIPAAEIDVIEANGQFTWTPGPEKTFTEWAPGFHTVEATWQRAVGLPEPGSLRWTFRVQ